MKNAKKKTSGLMIFSICLLIVAIATPVTLALFSDRKESTTQITFGKIEIDKGRTSVSVTLDSLLPGDNLFEDNVIAAKDAFSESMIMRVKYSFSAAQADTTLLQAYLDILNGQPFTTVNGYGDMNYADDYLYVVKSGEYVALYVSEDETYRQATKNDTGAAAFYVVQSEDPLTYELEENPTLVRKPDIVNGLMLKTQAVDTEGNIYISQYDAVNKTYTVTNTNTTVSDGYARNYRWFYNETDQYFYLCNYFADGTAASLADSVRIRVIERTATTKADSIQINSTTYDLTTKTGRDAVVSYYNNTYVPDFMLKVVTAGEIVTSEGANTSTLTELQRAAYENESNDFTSAREAYQTALSEFEAAKADYNTAYSNYATKKSAYNTAYNTFMNQWNIISAVATTAQINVKTAVDTFHADVMAELNKENHSQAADVTHTSLDSLIAALEANDYKTAASALVTAADAATQAKVVVNNSTMTAKKTALDNALLAYQAAVMNFKQARDLVAVAMKNLEELYVFALDGTNNKIPLELSQIVRYVQATADDVTAGNYVTEGGVNYKTDALGRKVVEATNLQYNKPITLTVSFEAVQSANLRKQNENTDLILGTTTIAELAEFFPANA